MQKKLIVLAIAGLASTAAFAQSNVTIYGTVDATLESVSANSATTSNLSRGNFGRVSSNSSYVGFRGTEDLGDGLKALFQFETGFNADTGIYSGSGRDTFVGINGGFGAVKLGQFTGPTRLIGTKLDLLPGRAGIGTSDSVIGRGVSPKLATASAPQASATFFDSRTANTVQYVSPNHNGFSVAVDYAAGETKSLDNATAAKQSNGKTYELGLNYANGPWYVGYAHGKNDYGTNSLAGTNSGVDTLLEWESDRLGIGYTFEAGHKLNFIWDRQDQNLSTGASNAGISKDFQKTGYSLQGLYKVSAPGSLILAYTVSKDASGNYLVSNTDTGAKEITLAYLHALSKRTILKAVWSRISNDPKVAYDFSGGVVGGSFGAGADPQGIALGVRHAF